MLFRILGPLEVVHRDQQVAIGGAKQRATLAFLLLHANRVVPTSKLLDALWAGSEPPATARKILQNAVSGLRGALSVNAVHVGAGTLVTKPPGYMVRVDDDQIDLSRFRKRVQEGRTELAAGSPKAASVILSEALSLWRGSALADLVEIGTDWPELTALENARIDAMEDYFAAELACGRHQTMLGALESMVESEPLRERLCGQLMLALYRCGRQAAALNTYSRVRATLVSDLGVEPGRELQLLQHASLNQDASLHLADMPAPDESIVVQWPRPDDRAQPDEPVPPAEVPHAEQQPIRPVLKPPVVRELSAVCREQVSLLLVQTELGFDRDAGEPEDIDRMRDEVALDIRGLVADFGGAVVTSMGSVSLAVFGPVDQNQDHAERAVRVADAILGRLCDVPVVRVAVSTGEASIRYRSEQIDVPQSPNGAVLERCQWLLAGAPSGAIRVCGVTRDATAAQVGYDQVDDGSRTWQVTCVRDPSRAATSSIGAPDRELELDVLHGTLERVRHRAVPHLITVLGEAGVGKTRLLREFERRVREQDVDPRFVVCDAPRLPAVNGGAVPSAIVSACCGITPADSATMAGDKLAGFLRRLRGSGEATRRLTHALRPLVDSPRPLGTVEMFDRLRSFLRTLAEDCPLVLVIEDLHRADDDLLDFVEGLGADLGEVPVLVILTARDDLLGRRPGWGGGMRQFSTIALDRPLAASQEPAAKIRYLDERVPGRRRDSLVAGVRAGAR